MKTSSALVSTEHGFDDFDISGHPVIRRARVPHSVKKGELFNIYYGLSTKSSCEWTGELLDSLQHADLFINGYKISFNPIFNEYRALNVKASEGGEFAGEEFDDLYEAILHCNKG